jgi:hypothetical protein
MASDSSWTFTTAIKATPVITWNTPAEITSATTLSETQLNATASVPGSFTYTPAAGSVLEPGLRTLSASFAPTDATNYTTATGAVNINVLPAGNITGSGDATISDALKALQTTVGLYIPTATELARGDVAPLVNGKPVPDGKVDVGDALVILKRVVGLVSW